MRISNPQPFARLTRQRHRRHWARTSAWFEAALRAEVVRPVGEDPEDLTRYLEQCRAIVVSRVLRIAEAYSKARWLWYLRFLPDHCFGDPTRPVLSAGHERALCEAATAISGQENTPGHDAIEYAADDEAIAQTLELLTSVSWLNQVEWLIRTCARGVRLSFTGSSELPPAYPSPEQAEATDIYMARLYGSGTAF